MKFCFAVITIFLSLCAFGNPPTLAPIALSDSTSSAASKIEITDRLETSIQPADKTDFENFEFQPQTKPDIKLGYTSNAIWIRMQLSNTTSGALKRLVYFSSALTGEMEMYLAGSQKPLQATGSSIPLYQRSYPSRLPAFQINLDPGQSKVFYIKRVSHHNLATKVFLADPARFESEESNSKAVLFFYLGGIMCLIVYNLFIGVYAKDLNYFLYGGFAGSLGAATLNTQGFFDAYVFPDLSFTLSHYLMIFSSLAILSCLAFVHKFLNFSQTLPKALIGCWILTISSLITLIQGIFPVDGAQALFGHLTDLTIVCMLIYLITCGWIVYKRGYKLAQFFLLSWVSLFVGVMGWFGMTYGVLHNSPLTSHALMLGNMGEMLILSLGLAYKISILDQEKKQAVIQALEKERYHRLVKVLSHDLANAILIFSTYVQRLKRMITGSQESDTILKLENAVGNMKGMLDLVRGEEAFNSFRLSASLKPVDLSEVVHEVVSFYEEPISKKGLDLKIDIPADSYVLADKTALANQVIANLLSNAVKFSYPNSSIAIELEKNSKFTILKICDHGVGIAKEDIAKIFFSDEIRSSRGTMKEKGSGLGSSLVKGYMDIFKGKIEVSSIHESLSKDSGTTVSLFFPHLPGTN